ncbi:hypothetical protein MKI79_07295 [Acinetobacter sp. A3.8]|uniref:Uncharacterized protein n=1 Tax=Acinetobacter sedimenti TaxID=2919922 RepID=A0A9X1WWZ8_9GAMM|nr:hypothetical protein [Acinetobacter sedimenti]MCJ8146704.1 hypothetical protein [Acinetobacter sedimenti]
MQQGQVLVDITYQAEFSDQAHFTLTCIELFGVRPSDRMEIKEPIFFIQ